MAERTHIPSSPACGEWETLLTDALDGLLGPDVEARFTAHKAVCPACAALHEEARKGREWLQFLSPAPEPPDGLLEKILAHTGPGHPAESGWRAGSPIPARGRHCWCSRLCSAGVAAAELPGPHALRNAAAASDDGGHGVFLYRTHDEYDRCAFVDTAACRSAAAGDAGVHGAPVEHGFGAHRSLLRSSAVCVRS